MIGFRNILSRYNRHIKKQAFYDTDNYMHCPFSHSVIYLWWLESVTQTRMSATILSIPVW